MPQGPHWAGSLSHWFCLLARWTALAGELEAALQRVFYPDTVEEWLEENVHPSLQRLQALLQDLGEVAGPRQDSGQDS